MEVDQVNLGELEEIYTTMMPVVYRFAVARLGTSDGEEVTSEVFHAAVVAIRNEEQEKVTPAWLMAVARNKVVDRWRQAERRRSILRRHQPRPTELMTFPEDWMHDDRRPRVVATLNRLNPRHRRLLVAHYVDGLTAPQLAETLDASVSSIESALARARRTFRRIYSEEM